MNDLIAYLNRKMKKIEFTDDSEIWINSKSFQFNLLSLDGRTFLLKLGNKFLELAAQKIDDERYLITVNGEIFEVEIRTALEEKAKKLLDARNLSSHKMEVKAPMPGMILKVIKQVGEEVLSGESVIILEAMKMENELRSPVTGKLKELFVKEGSPVEKGIKLFSIES
jgi:biotin carboxyl carrier protein